MGEMATGVRMRALGHAAWIVTAAMAVMLFAATSAAAQDTIFGSAVPTTVDSGDGSSVNVGVKFSSEVAGTITGIRFYKATANTGTHIGSLWSATGTLLATATFTNETASGWQQVNFTTPVSIDPNTTYIASYLAPKGHYSDTPSAFATSAVTNPPLTALANTTSINGVYNYSTTNKLPTSSFKATNYWVDVNFEPGTSTPPGADTIFGSAVPTTVDSGDGSSVNVGVKFSSEVAGTITGIRFYKATANTGTHIGSLWSATGTLLATATFTNETASGWQQVNFTTPVSIDPNTTYIASYLAPKGHYSDTPSAFATSAVTNPPLTALANTTSINGVYNYSTTNKLPTSSFKATNYWVDVNFEPGTSTLTAPGQVTGVSASAGNGSAIVSWSAPSTGGAPTSYTITPYIGSAAQPTTTISGSPPATSTTIAGLINGDSYTFTVRASNSAGAGPVSASSNAVTPTAPTAPTAPSEVKAVAGNASATVNWTAPSSNGGSPITSYTITPYIGSAAQTPTTVSGNPPATNTAITGLTNGTNYTFTVTATNTYGTGPASTPSNAVTPTAGTIAYPDLQLLMPVGEISIKSTSSSRTLEFTHITWDTGEGPWEVRPSYNEATGISQGYQALYTMPSPGVWKYAYSVPVVGPFLWVPPSDYRFPLDKFGVYSVASGGGIGAEVASSPKVDFCMTADTEVGGVPNTPSFNVYYDSNCDKPTGTLGLDVGWGDMYDAYDGGEGIEITNLPNGTYWLQGEVDPDHYFQESNYADNFTDTKIQIEGNTVKVLEQTHPDSTPPTVTLTSPTTESTLSGTVTLSATASGPAPISSVQFLLDGEPIGAPVTSAPYTVQWPVGSTPAGKHFISAQAVDSRGFIGTAADVPVTTQAGSGEEKTNEPPSISIIKPVAGEQVWGTTQVTANVSDKVGIASVQFYLDGKALGSPVTTAPYAVNWETEKTTNGLHTLTAAAIDTSGNVGEASPVQVTAQNPPEEGPCFVTDAEVTANGHGTTTTQPFTTADAGEQVIALVASDGPAGAGKQSSIVSGAGLEWKLVARANTRAGDSEIWAATALTPLSNVTVTSTPKAGGYDQTLTVVSIQMSDGIGASATAGAASGAPSVSLTTTEEGSFVLGVGNDYDTATGRTLGLNQVMLRQYLDTGTGDTYWSQYLGSVTGAAGSVITLNDTAPTSDQWNMAAVEVLGDGPGK